MKRRKHLFQYFITYFLFIHLATHFTDGNAGDEICPENICQNGGTCLTDGVNGRFYCECPPSYTGTICQFTNAEKPCRLKCANGGECERNNRLMREVCHCQPGFQGELCDQIEDCTTIPCKDKKVCLYNVDLQEFNCQDDFCQFNNPCQFNATCRPVQNDYFCECPFGLSGKNCSEDIDECASNDSICKNNGICENNMGAFECHCPAGFEGNFCEKSIGMCHRNPCQNRGICRELPSAYSCHCFANFTGPHCETDLSKECPLSQQLVHLSNGSIKCLCPEGLMGSNCDIPIPSTKSPKIIEDQTIKADLPTSSLPSFVFQQTTLRFPTPPVTFSSKIEENDPSNKISQTRLKLTQSHLNPENLTCDELQCHMKNNQICRVRKNLNGTAQPAFCTCPHGLIGENCGRPITVTFTNLSIFLHENFKSIRPNSIYSDYSIEFSFRTTLPSVLLAIGDGITGQSEFEILLREGKLVVKFFNSFKFEFKDLKALNDAKWYTIRLADWKKNGLFLEVLDDETDQVLAYRNLSIKRPLQVFMTRIGRKGNDYFIGCMRDAKIYNETIDFLQHEARSVGIESGCRRQEQCSKHNEGCANSAKCVDMWLERYCRCKRPYFGTSCSEKFDEATFGHSNQSSFIEYLLNEDALSIRSKTEVSFFLRTNSPNGNVFYLGETGNEDDGTFISAELVTGFLQTNVRIGGRQIFSRKTKRSLSDNNEHFIEILRTQNHLSIRIDGVKDEKADIKVNRPFEHPLLAQTLVIGSLLPGQVRSDAFRNGSAFFKGTMQDFRVNDKIVLFNEYDNANLPTNKALTNELSQATFGQQMSRQNILTGTVSDDVCAHSNLCVKGECLNTFNDFSCSCDTGWFGSLCDKRDYCGSSANPCSLKSKCLNINGGYVCLAPATFASSSFAKFSLNLASNYLPPIKQTNLTFHLRTRSLDANLLKMTASAESLQISVNNGTNILLNYRNKSSFNNNSIALDSGTKLSDGKWHTISFLDNSQHLDLVFDNTLFSSNVSFSLKRFALDPKSELLFGKDAQNGFKGCLRDVHFGSMSPLSFFEGTNGIGGFKKSEQIVYFKLVEQQNIRAQDCFSDKVCFDGPLNPCLNGAVCNDLFNKRKCKCPPGFGGEFCQINLDDCDMINERHSNSSQKCGKNGVCVDRIANFSCICDAGFTGSQCEIQTSHDDPCDDFKTTCMNGGKCRSTLEGELKCSCPPNFVGEYCQTMRKTKCAKSPCENDGKCADDDNESFHCVCPDHYGGELCDLKLNSGDPCRQRPCQNGGRCLSTRDVMSTKQHTVFPTFSSQNFTCDCLPNFEGKLCERFVDVCAKSAACQNGGECENVFGNRICHCPEGWRGADCSVDVDECTESAPCENGAHCQNLAGSFKCDCPQFYFGDHCNVIGACANSPCRNGAECLQESSEEYTCRCAHGYRGKYCEEEIDFCVDEPCLNGATCHRFIGGFECFCLAGYNGTNCEVDIDECALAEEYPCSNNGTCIDLVNAFECDCSKTGYTGPQCLDDIDECAIVVEELSSDHLPVLKTHKNVDNNDGVLMDTLLRTTLATQNRTILLNCVYGLCTNFPGSYRCDCEEGFIGERCNMANPCIPDMRTNHTLHSCAHGRCVNPMVVRQASGREVTQHECDCHAGYSGPQCTFLMQAPKPLALGFILGPLTVLVIVLFIFGAMLFLFVARKKRATQGSYSPSTQEMTGTIRVAAPPPRSLSLSAYKYDDSKKLKDSVNASLNNNLF